MSHFQRILFCAKSINARYEPILLSQHRDKSLACPTIEIRIRQLHGV